MRGLAELRSLDRTLKDIASELRIVTLAADLPVCIVHELLLLKDILYPRGRCDRNLRTESPSPSQAFLSLNPALPHDTYITAGVL